MNLKKDVCDNPVTMDEILVSLKGMENSKSPGDRFTKVIENRKSKITLKISLRARIRAFH
jgi:hypothetical protein